MCDDICDCIDNNEELLHSSSTCLKRYTVHNHVKSVPLPINPVRKNTKFKVGDMFL